MARHDTRIIGIGKPMQVLTQAHHIEGAMGDAFPVPSVVGESLAMTLVDGEGEVAHRMVRRDYQGRFDIWKLRTIMDRGSLQEWRFHHVPMFATRARDVTEALLAAARRGTTLYEPD